MVFEKRFQQQDCNRHLKFLDLALIDKIVKTILIYCLQKPAADVTKKHSL
jgi:hypothetical protein